MMLKPLILASVMTALSACATYNRVYGTGTQQRPAPIERSQPVIIQEDNNPRTSERQVFEPARETTTTQDPAPDRNTSQPASDSPMADPRDTSPTGTLLTSARSAAQAGELERAAAITERALSISPRDAVVWYELARIRSLQQRYSEADGLARRALSMAGSDQRLRQEIEALISSIARLRE
jgi:tetratricopeptide (TPR) repeat protein